MKKSYIIYGMIAMAAIVSCNKLESAEQPAATETEQGKGYDVIYASTEPVTKTTIAGSGINEYIEWVAGDEVALFAMSTDGYKGVKYRAKSGGRTAEFEVVGSSLSGCMTAICPFTAFEQNGDWGDNGYPDIYPCVSSEQDGTFHNVVLGGAAESSGSNHFLFTALSSVIKLDVPAEKNVTRIILESTNNISGPFHAHYNGKVWSTDNTGVTGTKGKRIVVRAQAGKTFSGPVYIAALPCTSTSDITITFVSSDDRAAEVTRTGVLAFKANNIEDFGKAKFNYSYYSKAFSINSAGHQVFIAPGNLQYQAKTNTWRFAEHQWDYVGVAPSTQYDKAIAGTVFEESTKSNNEDRSGQYAGWIDLFGFGTTGFNKKYPYMNSTNGDDYPKVDLSIEENFNYDWGRYCEISNDNYKDKKWHTISRDEWEYLHGRDNNTKWGLIEMSVNVPGSSENHTVYGQILLPDYFDLPEGAKFVSGNNNNVFTKYTLEEFKKLEAAGAILLPYCGYRYEGYMGFGSYGRYHSTENAKPFDIYNTTNGCGHSGAYDNKHFHAVRLVRDVE